MSEIAADDTARSVGDAREMGSKSAANRSRSGGQSAPPKPAFTEGAPAKAAAEPCRVIAKTATSKSTSVATATDAAAAMAATATAVATTATTATAATRGGVTCKDNSAHHDGS
jgi:hypothetical protein